MFHILCIIGFIIVFGYSIYTIIKEGRIPQSISSTVYTLDEKNKWLFSFVMFCVAFMIVPQLMEISVDHSRKYVWLMIVGLLGVGADPLRDGSKNIVHYVSAALCGFASQVVILLNQPQLLLLWALYVPYTLIYECSGKNMFFAEMIMMLSIAIFCLI